MLAARAAKGDGHVAAGFATQPWQPSVEEGTDLSEIFAHFGLRIQIVAHDAIAAREGP